MKILIIGGGGREHALAWKLSQSANTQIWCIPGNAGIAKVAECLAGSIADIQSLVKSAIQLRPDLTVVGPENPLVEGVADEFQKVGLKVVGPTRAAAQLEGSKIFAKQFLERNGIPTAPTYGIFDSVGDAYAGMCSVDWPVVIKADGPCAGKGVLVTSSADEATAFIERVMEKREFGAAGRQILLEEALEGRELSYIVLTDGESILRLVPARDHKRAFDNDEGPNTGGMGAYTADGLIPAELEQEILAKIVRPTLQGMAREGTRFRGFLYCGLMLTSGGPKVLEFNCRMGDPECQAIVTRMDFDLAEALQAATEARLAEIVARWRPGASVCVVLASGGYPGAYQTGKSIAGLAEAEGVAGVAVFHAGTRAAGPGYVTAGGRVLGVTATGGDLRVASSRAYDAARRIHFDEVHYRKDIGHIE
ncbi:MAG TPA: phosphoribosylamine--glycine ligase [Candidatus Acidoferrales bacterium]|nr:phosphoribosylamine--glycine ligase [Candidatus Acidoferrales bacterium]